MMTDNDIIKALECCMESECDKCEYQDNTACKEYIFQDCLKLIKSKMDEVKALKYYYKECLKDLSKAHAENDRKAHILDSYALQYGTVVDKDKLLKDAKAEAVREFIDKVSKDYGYISSDWSHGEHPKVVECDDLETIYHEFYEWDYETGTT